MDVEALYQRYGAMVMRRCRQLLRDEDQALDATQDVFVQLLEHRSRLQAEYPSSLLYRIATNLCLNRIRDRRRRGETADEELLDSIAEWDGKLLVVNFWATWCPPCLHEIPMFIALQERYGDQGLQLIGIAIDDGDKVAVFVEEIGLNYPALHGQLDAIEVMAAYGNKSGGLPYTVIISRSGQIVARHPGVLDEAAATALVEEFL